MKTTPMKHQTIALGRMEARDYFALFMDMGTGKSWTFLADAERRFLAGQLDALLIIAPNGVHTNWVLREIPEHLEAPHMAVAFRSGAGKRESERMRRVLKPVPRDEPRQLHVLAINIEALNFPVGFKMALAFVRAHANVMVVVDESDTIKNPKSGWTKAVMRLGHVARYRRIGTGTPSPESPMDIFAQMEFLEPGLLGTTSYRAFVAEHAELLPPTHHLVTRIHERSMAARGGNKNIPPPQIIARDPVTDAPRWKNLDKLRLKLLPHSYRVLKSECLDLPPKVYKTVFFDLTPRQRSLYDQLELNLRIELEGELTTFKSAAALIKLQQLTSGFVVIDGAPKLLGSDDNPRIKLLVQTAERIAGQFIVWARFVEELTQIAAALRDAGLSVVEFRGETKRADREVAIDSFQRGEARAFVGQPQSGGVGLTLTAATTVIYYSNDFRSRTRLQSEDRAHRKGTTASVVYIDLAAASTVDESITKAHQRKVNVARQLHDDRGLPLALEEEENSSII